MIPSLKEVSNRSGFSLHTVQRAFQHNPKIPVTLRTGILIMNAAEEIGLMPHHVRKWTRRKSGD